MCGIIGHIGQHDCVSLLVDGLRRLEYRGYDSAGIAVMGTDIHFFKQKGKVSRLEKSIND